MSVISKRHYVSPLACANVYMGLGEKDKAFEWLEKGYRERAPLTGLKVDPRYDGLRADARFAALIKKVGLPPPDGSFMVTIHSFREAFFFVSPSSTQPSHYREYRILGQMLCGSACIP